jgi:hypothetical protein
MEEVDLNKVNEELGIIYRTILNKLYMKMATPENIQIVEDELKEAVDSYLNPIIRGIRLDIILKK